MQNRTISFQTTNIIGGGQKCNSIYYIKLPEPARVDRLPFLILVCSEAV